MLQNNATLYHLLEIKDCIYWVLTMCQISFSYSEQTHLLSAHTTLWARCYCNLHFMKEKTEAQECKKTAMKLHWNLNLCNFWIRKIVNVSLIHMSKIIPQRIQYPQLQEDAAVWIGCCSTWSPDFREPLVMLLQEGSWNSQGKERCSGSLTADRTLYSDIHTRPIYLSAQFWSHSWSLCLPTHILLLSSMPLVHLTGACRRQLKSSVAAFGNLL